MTLQTEPNRQHFHQRLNILSIVVILTFGFMGARLWQLQIVRGSALAQRAEQNRIRTIQIVAPRGTITDRSNSILVENRPSFNLLLYRESVKDFADTSNFIIEKLGVKPDELVARMRRNRTSGVYRPIVIKEDVGIEDISIVEAHRRDHPEIQLGPEPRRLYRYGKTAAHVLGYVGEVSEDELTGNLVPGARTGDLIGKSGLEKTYNKCLTGQDGRRQILVDSVGREVGLLDQQDSIVGGEVQVTLDLGLQRVAENLLEDKVGAIVAMDPRNGEILVMASSPSFDPNSFSTRISEEDWNLLINDPDHPLQNRAIQNSYSPGSIFKLIMAEAALEEGMLPEGTTVYCSGAAVFYNRVFHCLAHNGHGYLDLEGAITRSCNIFFYEMGRRLGISHIADHARELGLGERTGVDLPGERAGVMPSPEWKQQVRGSKWYAGETISVAIGQGAVSVTPLQILRAVSAIATDGKLVTPHVLLRAERPPDSPAPQPVRRLPVDHESLQRIREGMWGSVNNYGTSHNAALPGLDICGKTGTVQVISNEGKKEIKKTDQDLEDHSWFVGFAKKNDPEIAVVVFIEHGGKGGVAAAPIAREIFRTYYADSAGREMLTQTRPSNEGGWR